MASATQNLAQLENARSLALGEARYYPTILPGVFPIIRASTNESLEVLRWGADFLAETYASPTWPAEAKEKSVKEALELLQEYLDVDDPGVVKSAVQAAASIYPLVFRHTITDPNDAKPWQLMQAIKSNILQRMDVAPPGVRVCCVKFVQQVVLVQTPGMVDPRRPEQNEPSVALLPREHRLIQASQMDAEAHALLDRLLDILRGDHSDALLITATLNSLGVLIQRRPALGNKIINDLLQGFNPLKLANSPMTPKTKVMLKSIERTTRALLINVLKRNPENPNSGKIQMFLEHINRTRIDVFDESNRKRAAPAEPTDGLDPAKRQRLAAAPQNEPPVVPPLPPGPVSLRQLFTLTENPTMASVDVQIFQDPDQLLRVLVPVLHSIESAKLDFAINAVRARYLALSKQQAQDAAAAAAAATIAPAVASAPADDDEEEYEPDFGPAEDAEQILNKMDGAPPVSLPGAVPSAPLAPYRLPDAPPLTEDEAVAYGTNTASRAFGMLPALEGAPPKIKAAKFGFNRLAANNYDRDSWFTILTRLATRGSAGLEDPESNMKSEYAIGKKGSFTLSDTIRGLLFGYVMQDWRNRIKLAISWLNEEWYNDRIQLEALRANAEATANGNGITNSEPIGNYHIWALKLIQAILPFIEGGVGPNGEKDADKRLLIPFISEIPELSSEILDEIRKMAEDPERINLAALVLVYLYQFRPPVKEMAVDVLETMYRTNDRARPVVSRYLQKWRPAVLQKAEPASEIKSETANGALEVKAA